MKIKLMVDRQTRGKLVKKGEIIDIPEQAAEDLIKIKQAVIPVEKKGK